MKSYANLLVRLGLLACTLVAAAATPVGAAEPFEAFLNGLKQRNMHDMALEYLDAMRDSQMLTPAQRDVITYEEARTLVEYATAERDIGKKNEYLDRASTKFNEFIAQHASHPLTASAQTQLGNVLVVRGQTMLSAAERDPAGAAQLKKDAKAAFDQAVKIFADAEKRFKEEVESYPKFLAPNDPQVELRERARGNLLQAQLFHAAVLYEMVGTEKDRTTAAAKKMLQDAAAMYEQVYEDWRTRIAGLMARIKQGQCYQELGDTKRALGIYANILDQPAELNELRKLRASAMYLSLQCWLDPKENKLELAALKGEEFLNQSRTEEERLPEWLAVRYHTALAYKQQAEKVGKEDATHGNLLRRAQDHVQMVANNTGSYQGPARLLLRQLRGIDADDTRPPQNFAEALDRGRMALDEMSAKATLIKLAPTMKDEANIPKYQEEALAGRQTAIDMFQAALALKSESSPADEVAIIRYYLCYLYYQIDRNYDAAVMGEYLLRYYPNSAGARGAAKIALAAYVAEYTASMKAEQPSEFDKQKLVDVATAIAKRWPDDSEAVDAWSVLMAIAANERDVERTVEYLGKIPEDSPGRGNAELKAGQVLWSAYIEQSQAPEGERPPQAELDAMAAQAQSTLEKGIERMRANVKEGAEIDATLAAALLSLSQIYVMLGEAEKAVTILEDESMGPLTLIELQHPITAEGKFKEETYKLALRGYVATQALEKAEEAMNNLEKLVGGEGGGEQLTQIYIALGRELEEQVKLLRADPAKAEELQQVSKGFELFLQRIAEREQGNTFASLNWVSETFFSLGSGFDPGTGTVPPEALNYYQKSVDVDTRLEGMTGDPDITPDALLAVKLRHTQTLRRMGKYADAVNLVESVLKERNQLLDAQAEAAYIYMDWGRENPAYYNLAVMGARKSSKDAKGADVNTIWGWARLAVTTQSNPKFQDIYHEAQYNLARCRLLQAAAAAGSEREELVEHARRYIFLTNRMKPDMGGDAWRSRYDALLKTIQKAMGERPVGLEAFAAAAPPAPGAQ